ncbi:helix-turn-helix domain-containing protein [Lacicoccus qingdaonensis]|uniref:Helix-turn-helix domain-containing protein n=1 Tax=Lacicoccus qingdaonensis TaxID=576118 RepID=A0A1G9IT26_9BACL|nr:helix-turn-helix domain-containing protein [Salinicoccus qingdaonensis]SDL28206.1 Helix-turn-helix domain-containing protein [Salinicoccus qingdaonensis]
MKTTYPTVPLSHISQATQGDTEAIHEILNHYHYYMLHRSRRLMTDEYGNRYMVVDEMLLGRLQTRLMNEILSFNIE